MTREMLYDAITEVTDELILDAMAFQPAKNRVRWLKFGSIAAAVVLMAGLGAGVFSGKIPWLPVSSQTGGSGHNDSSTFMSYAGPVFPLTTVEGGGGLTAQREITYDFQGWSDGDTRPFYGLATKDSYTLTNPTGEDKTVTLLYPFASDLYTLYQNLPALTADGVKLDTEVLAGSYCGGAGNGFFYDSTGYAGRLTRPQSWVDYQTILSDGSYQAAALEDWPNLSDIPVTVYEITNPWLAEDMRADNPHIHASTVHGRNKTTVLSYGFNSYCSNSPDEGTARWGFSVPRPPKEGSSVYPGFYEKERAEVHYLIVVGDPAAKFELLGTSDGAPESTDYLKWGVEIGADLRQYETDLETALRTVAEQMYAARSWDRNYGTANLPDFKLYFGMMKDCLLSYGLLADNPVDRYSVGWLEELDFDGMDRVFYLKAQAVIPAGESVTVEASFLKKASFDYACSGSQNKDVYGYDLVTRLGTNLDITAQTAKAVNTQGVKIVRQNLGFDWENGVDTVILDSTVEHYYMEVRRIQKK